MRKYSQIIFKLLNSIFRVPICSEYIDTVSVSPLHQGKGIGKKLLTSAIATTKAENHKKIGLLVDFKNPNAKKLYLALGFKSVGKKQLGYSVYEHLQLKLYA